MNITINGRITNVLPARKGVSKAGNEWVSQDFVIESTPEEKICFNIFGEDKIKQSGLQIGAIASVTCKIESKEWNGKFFTSISYVDGIVQSVQQPIVQTQTTQHNKPTPVPTQQTSGTSADELPF